MKQLEASEVVAVSGGTVSVVVDPALAPTCPVAVPPPSF